MIKITLRDLVYIVPDLINLFLAGFVFMSFYNWLNGKEMNISLLIVWSLFISFLIKNIYSVIHAFVLKDVQVNDAVKIIIYSITGVILSGICTYLKKTKCMQKLLNHTNNKSINDDIFDDIIDYSNPTQMHIYIKGSDICYVGEFSSREEKGMESWIVLINYYRANKETLQMINTQPAEQKKTRSTVAINFANIERIELFYENESKVWENLKR